MEMKNKMSNQNTSNKNSSYIYLEKRHDGREYDRDKFLEKSRKYSEAMKKDAK